ncbi:hypothetical protein BGZ80_001986 [Entomortierella chlamydospora]|uniref:non-specific serine/threonine protein kinase n=1 Tax=Entomortierella chlamydospora TaxID=101097 RepID=A0A9P6MQ18_9FUNG|nr:hypothetical protein BGZ79_004159 [Entomortierella chlamydospora]KAG0009862.1 hypothetical protein BGZ80_001986 [Entomortierella chlamydospora]
MLGPASLRSQQPTKSSLKTYGSRNKRTSASATATTASGTAVRQFSWDRLENERKARIEQAQARRVEQDGHNQSMSDLNVAAVTPDDDMLYSDSELDGDIQLDKTTNRATKTIHSNPFYIGDHVSSTQGSDSDQSDRLSQTRSIHHPSRLSTSTRQSDQNPVMTIRSTQDSDSEMEPQPQSRLSGGSNIRSAIRQLGPPGGNASVASSSQLSLASTKVSQVTDPSALRKVMFQEKKFFEEDHGDEDSNGEGDDGDEVLFRTPSFHILQKLRELPKPRLPEPRVNPFGFGSLPESGSSSGSGQSSDSRPESRQEIENEERVPSKLSTEAPSATTTTTTTRNPFLDSPTTKKSMDILNKRAQQLIELQRHRKPKSHHGTSKPDNDTSMEIGREELMLDMYDYRQDGRTSDNRSMKYDEAAQSEHTTFRRNTRQTTPESQDAGRTGKDDSLDIALGKRMSSIEITPRRLLAKQRKMADLSSMPPAPSFLETTRADNSDDDNQSKPLRLFLDRDIPKNEQDDLDSILMRAQKNRQILSSSSLFSGILLGQKCEGSSVQPPVQHSGEHRRSSLAAPKRPQLPKFERSSSSNILGVNSKPSPYKNDLPDNLPNPFQVSHDYDARSRQSNPQLIPSRELTPPRFVPQLLSRSSQPSPPVQQASIQQNQPNETSQPPQYHQPERKIRSLRRPPAVLVSNRKSVFKPTVDDLLSICDQQFFTQFQYLDANGQTHTKDSRGILDFETLLPECMVSSLSKIGEASYSEVYTVELPVEQQKERLASRLQKQKHMIRPQDEFALFQSPRLNTYVQESAEDDLLDNKSGTTKLVMKVMPFCDDQDNSGTTSQVIQERGRRTKGRRKAETTLLALEDIYREAMVSTQIMHGWKGFIGSFGALVVRGKYPKTFLSVWDRFRKENGTESERPDIFTKDQLYCIILLPYGGIDLEHSPLTDWRQAWSVLTQVAASLESKEQAPFWFEHRDLHWGNILVKGTQQKQIVFPKREILEPNDSVGISEKDTRDNGDSPNTRSVPTFGIIVQMIDFTLARVQGDKGNLIYMDLEKDQDLFRGQGDYQFEIYRKMRKQIGKDWAASCPRTNLYWLHYVADKLLTEKNLQKPKQSSRSTTEGSTAKRHSTKANLSVSEDEKLELWCYERVLAVSKMNLDRLDPSGQTPSGSVLDLLLFNQP